MIMVLCAVLTVPAVTRAQKAADTKPGSDRPNILLILVDDMGWMDLRCQGNARLETPNIDRLASQGMRFTNAYAAAPVCSPVRAATLTGKSPARLRITNHLPDQKRFIPENPVLLPAPMLDHLPLEHVTIAERLKASGYATAFLGKWHLCGRGQTKDLGRGLPEFHPERQGFDVNIGGCAYGGPPTFFDPYRIYKLPSRKKGEYLPDRLADETITVLRRNRDKPFLLFLWNYAVHWPMEAPADLVEKYAPRKGPGLRDHRYGAMIEALDRSIGRILKTLDDLELTEKTLVIFTSDNGGYSGVADNRPLREGKGYLYEGGIRVPLIVRWPGVVKPGSVCDAPVISMDFYPTILEACDLSIDTPGLDGESLMPLLGQRGELKRDAIYFHYPNYAWHRSNRLGGAIRSGPYKLIEHYDDGSYELYNLSADIGETRDLSKREPGKAHELLEKLRTWRKETRAAMPRPAPR